ncbi:sensor domain-containing phosphodiesterase [Athalassotoga saccharophila]|uniref:sensor domain-containing phosphodiesterase n=1 Tax=Athalassotoga saccharophila TaxID=1441386 RepID=UPI00137A4B06|nr:EAL domain-containing protein [Athalassotoga saccharophila]BBJ28428.1 diguanylate cyclase/phosphodiesterase [Athalassotoga saccharophila]
MYEVNQEDSHEIFNILSESEVLGVFLFTTQGFLYVNKFFEKFTEYTFDELEEKHLKPWDLLYYESDRRAACEIAKKREKGEPLKVPWENLKVVSKSGKTLWVNLITSTVKIHGKYAGIGTFIDVTKDHLQREKLENLERLHSVISNVNQMLVRERDENELLKKVCDIFVEDGKFKMAWVGIKDEKGFIRPFYSSNDIYGYAKTLQFNTKDNPQFGMVLRAFHKQRVYINNSTVKNPFMFPWREELASMNFLSSAAIPLVKMGSSIGVINIYSEKEGIFDRENYKLLDEIKDDLEFALNKIEFERQNYILSTALENTTDCVVVTDYDGTITYVNNGFERITGYKRSDVIGQNPRILKSGLHDERFYKAFWERIKSGHIYNGIFINRKRDGSLVYLDKTVVPIKINDKIKYFVSIDKDITKMREYEDMIYKLSLYDPVTDLPNADLFYEETSKRILLSQKFALILIGLRDFSNINSLFTFEAGDQVLREIANRLNELFPVLEGGFVSKLKGDNFGIIIQSPSDIARVVENLKEILDRTFTVKGNEITLHYNLGFAFYPEDGDKPDVIISNATLTLSSAKSLGDKSVGFFNEEIKESVRKEILMKNELEMAFKNSEFILFFQPYFDTISGNISGMEALIRWSRDGRIIPPNEFIPFLEKDPLIVEVEKWVIETVVKKIKEWKENNFRVVPVSVNISPRTFERENLDGEIIKVLDSYDVDPQLLSLEITERLFLGHMDRAMKILSKLRSSGIKIALDDFGTGYSSFLYLKSLPVDILKIDISFIRNIHKDERDFAIVDTIISLSRKMGIKTIAEGVEEMEQLKLLRFSGCDAIQGYLFSRPVDENKIVELIKK